MENSMERQSSTSVKQETVKRKPQWGTPSRLFILQVFCKELVTIKQDDTKSTQEAAIKSARGNSGELVLYGGTVQKKISENDNILPVIVYVVAGRYKYMNMPWVSGKPLVRTSPPSGVRTRSTMLSSRFFTPPLFSSLWVTCTVISSRELSE